MGVRDRDRLGARQRSRKVRATHRGSHPSGQHHALWVYARRRSPPPPLQVRVVTEADLAFDSAKELAEQPTDAEVAAVGGGGVEGVVVEGVVEEEGVVVLVLVLVVIVEWW